MRVREFAVPLQAFLAITICFSLVWMVYAMAFFDATPPTAAEIGSLSTNDPEINELKTAAALTVNAMFGIGPTQILLPTATPTFAETLLAMFTPSFTLTVPNTATVTSTSIVALTSTRADRSNPSHPISTPTRTATPISTFITVPPPTITTEPPPPTVTLETPSETATEPPTETATEPPTEPPTEIPTEVPTEPPTEAPTEPQPTNPPVP